MIPIRDDAPHYTTPWVNYFLIAMNTAVFLFVELPQSPRHLNSLFFTFGMVPAHLTKGLQTGDFAAALVPVLTSMFLHAGWLHIIFNMWWLWIFGDNVEDWLGHFPYLLFYLLGGLGAAIVHILFNLGSKVPSVGASGAIAGVMGAYFVLFPSARVLTFIFVFFTWLPAWLILGYWFVLQFLTGAATSMAPAGQGSAGGVAVWAHVGGFLTGVVMIKLFPRRAPRYSSAWR
jgi:membrane associated rhomboid family serine protease